MRLRGPTKTRLFVPWAWTLVLACIQPQALRGDSPESSAGSVLHRRAESHLNPSKGTDGWDRLLSDEQPTEDRAPRRSGGGAAIPRKHLEKAASARGLPAQEPDAITAWLDEEVGPTASSARNLRRPSAGSSAAATSSAPTGRTSSVGAVEMFWPLLLVLAVIAGAAVLASRYLGKSAGVGRGGVLDVLAHHRLSSKQSFCLVRLGRRLIVVGVTPERLSAIAEIGDPVEVAEVIAAVERRRPQSFTAALGRFQADDVVEGDSKAEGVDGRVARDEPLPAQRLAAAREGLRQLVDRVHGLSAVATVGAGR